MRLLVFAATTSRQSINRQLLDYAVRLLDADVEVQVEVELIDLNDYEMPIYSVDRERESGIPNAAQVFFDKIGAADAVLVSFAEHNGFYTAAYKNIFDWASRIEMRVYQEKPVVLFSTSVGARGGANVLQAAVMAGQFFGYDVKASLSIPSFHESFDTDSGSLRDPELDRQFRDALASFGETAEVAS